jgi:uncharacterized repeat protein (TIGR01451 family)
VNVDRRRWRASVIRGRVLAAGLVLLGAGCAFLGFGARPRKDLATVPGATAIQQGVPSLLTAKPTSGSVSETSETRGRSLFAGLPLIFEPNQGQGNLDPKDARAKFVARGSGYSLFLGSEGATLGLVTQNRSKKAQVSQAAQVQYLEMKLAGANRDARLSGAAPLPGHSNYFMGNDTTKWRTGVPHFGRIRYQEVYPGVDLVFYGNQGQLEYDFQVAPGADPSQAELEFNGARQLQVRDGALIIKCAGGNVRLEAPQVYQEISGQKHPVQGSFVLRGANRAGFAIGAYDRSRELIIDSILNFSTYFGGSGDEQSTSVAVDGSFNIYLTGSTTSANLPPSGGTVFQSALAGGQDAYVAKITAPLGSIAAVLDYVTYLGGDGTDTPVGIKVDGAGDAFVAGTTSSTNFPTIASTAYQSVPQAGSTGTSHAFVTELDPAAATLKYSSYLSGNGTEIASGMTIDSFGNVFITGTTTSQDVASTTDQFPASTVPQALAFQANPRSSIQFFVTKVNTQSTGTGSIAYSTYFGGGNFETATPVAVGGGIAVDTSGNIYFSGTTNFTFTGCSGCGSTDFPILDAYQPCLDQPPPTTVVNPQSCTTATTNTATDAFVAKLNPAGGQGQQLIWSTYLGGSETDSSTGVALDTGAANVYVVGTTNSDDFVNTGSLFTFASYQKCLNNTPQTTSSTTTISCPTGLTGAPTDAFAARLTNPTTTTTTTNVALNYFSYLGGVNDEVGSAITVDSAAGALITGWTQSPFTNADGTFPLSPNPNSIQGSLNGTQDAFVARLNTQAVTGQTTIASYANYFGGTDIDSGTGIALDVNQNTYLAGDTKSVDLHVNKPLTVGTSNSGGYDAFVTQLASAVSLSIQGVLTQTSTQGFVDAGTSATFTYTITNNGPDLATGITVTDDLDPAKTGVPLTAVQASSTAGNCSGAGSNSTGISCGPMSIQSGSTATVTINVTPTGNSSGSQATFNGGTVQAIAPGNIVLAQTSVSATMSDFSMTVNPPNQTVTVAGDTANYTAVISPHPVYASSVQFSCTGTPTGSGCAFSPTSVTLQTASSGSVNLAITTTARPVIVPAVFLPKFLFAMGLVIPGLIVVGGSGSGRRRRIAGVLMLCTMFGLLVLLPACSHSSTQTPASGTPPGVYTVTVTASAGTNSKSQTVTLTVP